MVWKRQKMLCWNWSVVSLTMRLSKTSNITSTSCKKIRKGLKDDDEDRVISQSEMEKRFEKWLVP